MKKIAVLIYDLSVEYHITVVDGILSFFNDKKDDVVLLLAPVNAPHATTNGNDYQYWSIVSVLKNQEIDAVIVVANSFTEYIELEKLTKELKILEPKPIISIATPLDLKYNSYTYSSPNLAYEQIVEHLVTKHGRNKIAFFSGELNGSPDSAVRFDAYKKALKKNGLKYDKNLVFPGDFTPTITYYHIMNNYKTKEDVPYDAILCANDYMAVGAIGAFRELGINVPEDVCVVGFDDSAIAVNTIPTVTTVNQHIFESGTKAGELAYEAAYKRKVPSKVAVESVPVYRQSCGCIHSSNQGNSYYDQTGTYFDSPDAHKNVLNLFGNALNDISTIYHMLNMSDTIIDFNDYFKMLVQNLKSTYIEYFAACFYDKPKKVKPEDSFEVPKKARLMILYHARNNIQENYYNQGGIVFKTADGLLPAEVDGPWAGDYYILPISIQNMNYGYILCKLPMNKYTVYEVYLKIFINAMVHSYERTANEKARDNLESEKQKTERIARTDELTKVLNRRGFFEIAQKQISVSTATDNKGCVFFFDMDGLKKINDTYGHEVGDQAIKTMANVLKKICRSSDIVGRLSGDEFAIVAPGYDILKLSSLREKVEKACVKLSKKENLPVVVSMSVGGVEFSENNTDLQTLLSEADSCMYKEKNLKHKQKI